MDENMNNVVNNETEDLVEITNDQVVEQASSKTGLTGGQKAIGLGVIGFAIFGIVELVRFAIKGIKALVNKIKGKQAQQPDQKESQQTPDVIEVDNETMDEIQKESAK